MSISHSVMLAVLFRFFCLIDCLSAPKAGSVSVSQYMCQMTWTQNNAVVMPSDHCIYCGVIYRSPMHSFKGR